MKLFPLLHYYGLESLEFFQPTSIPWHLIEHLDARALKNHNQTLEQLAERGGLDVFELTALLLDMDYRDVWAEPFKTINDLAFAVKFLQKITQ